MQRCKHIMLVSSSQLATVKKIPMRSHVTFNFVIISYSSRPDLVHMWKIPEYIFTHIYTPFHQTHYSYSMSVDTYKDKTKT